MARVSALTAFCGALLATLFGLPVVSQDPASASPEAGEEVGIDAADDLRDAPAVQPDAQRGQQIIEYLIRDWPGGPQRAARLMIEKYGPPDQATSRFLSWRSNAPWTRTVVRRDESVHNFPVRHTDMLEQSVRYRVPADKMAAISEFHGSLTVDRTNGELIARCGSEAMNILALNLADEIARGARSPEQAREFYARTLALSKAGKSSPYMQALRFTAPAEPTADPDEELQFKLKQ